MIQLGLFASALAAMVPECGVMYPIAGTAGFANAQEGRRTNRNTYSAANFAERTLQGGAQPAVFALEWNATLGAARVPVLCGDTDFSNPKKERLYEEPLDLYASNVAFRFGSDHFGAFYSASVTESAMGQRYAMLPALIIQLYPLVSAPFVGVWQRGDGVSSYSLDWIGGAHVDTKWFGARVGYTGAKGVYGSVDERVIGVFGNVAIPFGEPIDSPWSFLRAGVERFDPKNLGADDVSEIIGMTSFFFRDLPFGESLEGDASTTPDDDTTTTAKRAVAISLPGELGALTEDRLKTLHFAQQGIAGWVDVDVSYALSPKPQIFDGQVAVHTPGYIPGHLIDDAESRVSEPGFLVKVGVVQIPPQYALGVEGGTFFAARAELRTETQFTFLLLFNDPEQLALYPYATNALTLRVSASLDVDR